jgi:hypothetical protein
MLHRVLTPSSFGFDSHFYEQTGGDAMSSQLKPVVANLIMEDFEEVTFSWPAF